MERYITINPHGNKEYIFNVKFINDNIKQDQLIYLYYEYPSYEEGKYYGLITSVDEESITIMAISGAEIIIRLSELCQKFGHDTAINTFSIVKLKVDRYGACEETKYTHDDLISTRYNKVIEINTDIISDGRFLLVKVKSPNNNNIRLLKITNTHIDGCKAIIRYGYETQNTMECRYNVPAIMTCKYDNITYEKLFSEYELIESFDTYDEFEKFFKSKLDIK